jgi:hypothetical protein
MGLSQESLVECFDLGGKDIILDPVSPHDF